MPKGAKKSASKPKLASKTNFSQGGLLLFIFIFAAVGGYILWRGFAAPAAPSVYLTPATAVHGSNTSFSVQVRENSGSASVNAVQANLSYPTSLLTLVSVDSTGSSFGTHAQTCPGDSSCSNAAGTINIARGTSCSTTCATLTGDQLVATLNFKTTAAGGAAAVSFTSGTALVSSTSNADILGSLSNAYGGTFTNDTSPPAVSITSPTNNQILPGGGVINVAVSAADAASQVSKVEVYVDGTLSGTLTSSPYTYAWNTAGASLSAHTITAKAYDTFNNAASSTTVNVTLTDQTAPTTPGTFRATTSSSSAVTLTWTASSDSVGVTAYKVKRGGTLIATVNAPALTYTDTGLSAGTSYTYSVQAVDAAGNISPAVSLNISTLSGTSGDIDGDGHVDATDLSILLGDWMTSNAESDLNKDGIVDVQDLSILLSAYGT